MAFIIIFIIVGFILYSSRDESQDPQRIKETEEKIANHKDIFSSQIEEIGHIQYTNLGNYMFGISRSKRKLVIKQYLYGVDYEPVVMKIIPIDSIIDCKIIKNNSEHKKDPMKRAVVGSFVGGDAGAIIGAQTAKTYSEIDSIEYQIITDCTYMPINRYNIYGFYEKKKYEIQKKQMAINPKIDYDPYFMIENLEELTMIIRNL